MIVSLASIGFAMGITDAKTRARIEAKNHPECLITTPETLHYS